MVRLALLFVLAAALCAAAPASAEPLTQGVAGTATGTVQQATATVETVATGVSTSVPASADSAVGGVVEAARTATQPASEAAADAPARVADAASAAPAAVTTAPTVVTTASAPATPSSSSPRAHHPKALSSTRDRGPARELRAGRDRAGAAASAQLPHRVAAPLAASPAAGHGVADAPRAAASERGTAAGPERDRHTPSFVPASGSASAAAGLFFAGAALLAGVLCLSGPRLMRRLSTVPAAYRPAAFALSLERPG
jgi:DNA polymerase-3 subunit gamma/tau